MDRREVVRATVKPTDGRTLRVVVHDGGRWPALCVAGRQIGGERRLAAAPFGIEDHDLVQIVPSWRNQHNVNIRCGLKHQSRGYPGGNR